jgi:chlorinating enzyme
MYHAKKHHQVTQETIHFYKEKGYCLYNQALFSPEKMKSLTDIFEEHLALKGDKLSDELDTPHLRDARLLQFLLADEVLDLVEQFIGPNIGLWSSHFICKDPFIGRATPWHEDSAYWKKKVDRFDNIVTVWLAIDRSNKGNGCMRVIPKSHKNGDDSDYEPVDKLRNTFSSQVKNVDEAQAVYFELEPGQCSLHDSRIIHGAAPNVSPYRRCGYTMRYFSTNIKIADGIMTKGEEHKVWLARGVDLAGNKYVIE